MNLNLEQVKRWSWVFWSWSLLQLACPAAQWVELTAEMETTSWPYRDANGVLNPDFRITTYHARCVLGTNRWFMEGDFVMASTLRWWSTGTNIIQETLVTGVPSKHTELFARNHPEAAANIGRSFAASIDTLDGNPGQLPRRLDLLLAPTARVCWLAFCSAKPLGIEMRHSGLGQNSSTLFPGVSAH